MHPVLKYQTATCSYIMIYSSSIMHLYNWESTYQWDVKNIQQLKTRHKNILFADKLEYNYITALAQV